LSRPARPAPRKDRASLARLLLRQFLSRPARTIAGAALAAILTGIVVNALILQKAHRPAVVVARTSAVTAPPAAAPAAPAAPQSASVDVQPPQRPTDLWAAADAPPAAARSSDPIRDLLRGDMGKSDASRLTTAAQSALIRLGFAIKADGVAGASTDQAIHEFERAHGLPQSTEITAKLVKQLSAAANAATH
jgi:hypothetical protein